MSLFFFALSVGSSRRSLFSLGMGNLQHTVTSRERGRFFDYFQLLV